MTKASTTTAAPSRPRPRTARKATVIYLLLAFFAWLLPVARPEAGWAEIPIVLFAFPWSLMALAFGAGPMEVGHTGLFMAIGIIANAWILYTWLARREKS